MTKRRFSDQFKRESVRLLRDSGKPITHIARELGIATTLLARWRRKIEAEEKNGLTPDDVDELKRLRRENARLREEVEILGKATAFFAGRRP